MFPRPTRGVVVRCESTAAWVLFGNAHIVLFVVCLSVHRYAIMAVITALSGFIIIIITFFVRLFSLSGQHRVLLVVLPSLLERSASEFFLNMLMAHFFIQILIMAGI